MMTVMPESRTVVVDVTALFNDTGCKEISDHGHGGEIKQRCLLRVTCVVHVMCVSGVCWVFCAYKFGCDLCTEFDE